MARQPEQIQYDGDVYQLEKTDPVDGGVGAVSNAPLLNLANRTAWLKKHVDDIESGVTDLAAYAKKDSPTFSGTPQAPTQATGDISNKIATDTFVWNAVNGLVTIDVSGGTTTTLNNTQAGWAIILLTGALTANKAVVLPARAGHWQVVNTTTGAYTVTVKTASGTGVVVTQGASSNIYCDGTNIGLQQTDFISPALLGTPTATTPAPSDNSTRIATTAYVRSLANGLSFTSVSVSNITANNVALTVDSVGTLVVITGFGGGTLTLPSAASVPSGKTISIRAANSAVSTNTLKAAAGDTLSGMLQSTSPAGVMRSGDSVIAVSDGANTWYILSDATYNFVSQALDQAFTAGQLVGANGYQKLPGAQKLILQWGIVNAYDGATFSYPIAFPNAALSITSSVGNNTTGIPELVQVQLSNASTFRTWGALIPGGGSNNTSVTSGSPVPTNFIAIGY